MKSVALTTTTATLVLQILWTSAATAQPTEKPEKLTALNVADAVRQLAPKLANQVEGKREAFVRAFRGRGFSDVGLSKVIGDALAKNHGFSIFRDAPNEIEGRLVRIPKDSSQPLVGFEIKAAVVDEDGNSRGVEVIVVRDADGGADVVEGTSEIAPPPGSPPNRKPQRFHPTIIRPKPGSLYGVELLRETSSDDYEEVSPVRNESGKIDYDLKHGDIYAVRIYNDSTYDAACAVLIDGLSRFAMTNDPATLNCLDLVQPGVPRIIKGYYRDDETVDAFQVGEYSKSVAARLLPESTDVGTIKVTFSAAWLNDKDKPADEKLRPEATIQGPPRNDPTINVQRHIGFKRAVVRLQYEP